jgi:nicotinamide mononucleotide transporter
MSGKNKIEIPRFSWWDWFLIVGFISVSVAVSVLRGNFSVLSFIAGTCSVLCVIFGVKGSVLNFLFGFLGSCIQGYMALRSGLYANAVLFLLYNVPMQFVGWAQWRKRMLGGGSEGIKTRWMSWPQRALLIVLSTAAVWGISRLLLKTADPQPVSDALAMTVAVGAQFLLTFAFIEQWFMWIVVNGANLVMWAIAATRGVQFAPIMVVQYVFYMMNSIYGIVWWSKMSKKA